MLLRSSAAILAAAMVLSASAALARPPGLSVNGTSLNGISLNGQASGKVQIKAVVLKDSSVLKAK